MNKFYLNLFANKYSHYSRLYKKIFNKTYGAASGEEMLHDLEAAIENYNSEQGEMCGKIKDINGKIVIALCTPLMKRVHQNHDYSGELVFIDASGGMDRYDCRIFMMLTHSAAGGLPLGCLIVTSESRDCITQALRLYLEILPKDGFFGRGSRGPLVFLSDDSEAERQSLHEVFPEATLILCVFHLLQAVWRFLWEGKNNIRKDHRPQLLSAVKKITFAGSVIALEEAYAEIQANDIASLYPNYLAHCKKLYDRRQAWAVCYRHHLLVRGNNTNNYAEAAMRILKDQIFERVRAYNMVQLLDFLVTRLPSYYERRLIDLANGRVNVTVSKRFLPGGSSIPKGDIIKVDGHNYEVRSQSKQDIVHHIDTSIWTCTCTAGMNGAPCKHQYAVVKNFGESSLNFLHLRDPHQREHLLFIATGEKNVRPGWFTPLPITGMTTDVNPEGMANGGDVEPMPSTSSGTAEMLQQNEVNVRSSNLSDYENDDIVNAGAIKLASTEASLHSCTTRLIEKLRKDPGELIEPAEAFIRQFNSIKTNSALATALKTFGKYTGASLALSSFKKGKMCNKKGTAIKVQPAAVSRRSTVLGGRRCLHTGRKVKDTCDSEIKKRKVADSSQLMPKKKPRKAPHSLSQCVANNEGIGQNKYSKW